MCGRYFVDEELHTGKYKLIRIDIHPGDKGVILTTNGYQQKVWGFPAVKGIVFNARQETLLEKSMFKDSNRCIVPVRGFYEWNRHKEKNIFMDMEEKPLYLAAIYKNDYYCIVTTEANESMKPVHDRMPLILEENEFDEWFRNGESLLSKHNKPLKRIQFVEQLGLF